MPPHTFAPDCAGCCRLTQKIAETEGQNSSLAAEASRFPTTTPPFLGLVPPSSRSRCCRLANQSKRNIPGPGLELSPRQGSVPHLLLWSPRLSSGGTRNGIGTPPVLLHLGLSSWLTGLRCWGSWSNKCLQKTGSHWPTQPSPAQPQQLFRHDSIHPNWLGEKLYQRTFAMVSPTHVFHNHAAKTNP